MKKTLILVLAITTILIITLGITVYGSTIEDSVTGLKVQSTNENVLEYWNTEVLKGTEEDDIRVTDGGITSFSISSSVVENINHHISMGDSIYFRLKLDYRKIDDGYLTYGFKINDEIKFKSNGYNSTSNDGLEYYPGSMNTTDVGIYIDDSTIDGIIEDSGKSYDEKFSALNVDGYKLIASYLDNLQVGFSASGNGDDDWEIDYLEFQYRIVDTAPIINSGATVNPDLSYNLIASEPISSYSIDGGNTWEEVSPADKSLVIKLNPGNNDILVKDQRGNESEVKTINDVNTIKIEGSFEVYDKLHDGTTKAELSEDSLSFKG